MATRGRTTHTVAGTSSCVRVGLSFIAVVLAAAACGTTHKDAPATPGATRSSMPSSSASRTLVPIPSRTALPTTSPSPGPAGGFSTTGSMSTPRESNTATLLSDGRVLIAGGLDRSSTNHNSRLLASAELYDPRSGTFSTTGSMSTPREGNTATLLSDGRVLMTGGFATSDYPGTPLASAELYDPRSGTFSTTGSMVSARSAHTATLLSDGRVLVAGGLSDGSAELYDPRSGKFEPAASMVEVRYEPTATRLADGRVLIAGGLGSPHSLASAELYDPGSGTFSPTGSMGSARLANTATLLSDGRGLIAGGGRNCEILCEALASAELYDPRSGTFSPTGSLGTARIGHSATLLSDGEVLIAGGGNYTPVLASAKVFSPKTGTFSTAGSMGTARWAHTATLLSDGRVLIAGGDDSSLDSLASAELWRLAIEPSQP